MAVEGEAQLHLGEAIRASHAVHRSSLTDARTSRHMSQPALVSCGKGEV